METFKGDSKWVCGLEKNDEKIQQKITDRSCSNEDIIIIQGASSPLPSGIPTYTVEIMNACLSGCSIYNIHVRCGWFSSAMLIDPNVFRRLCYDDCLVNDGNPLATGETLSFQYANSF
ncbi:hypothetical protein RND81_01G138200 [Saponaria officinalis]|uniref:Uncharacterized protein n=1 Tax=Saponaria officinalis TaxID=3572 RepID=A0AAW1NGZ8_SAPOF